jgi:IclR family KDG regulon transcriptional repressor
MEQTSVTHQSIVRAINFLKAFIPYNQPMGTNEFSKRFNLNKSTTCRILQVLRDNELLYQDQDTKKYQLGRFAADMGMTVIKSLQTHLITIAQPFLDELSITTGEGAALEVLSGQSSILAYVIATRKRLHVSANLGERLPVHAASGAKIIMAFSELDFVDKLLNKELKRFTPHTITDPEVFKEHLIEYRKQGVAFDHGELDEDVHTVAAPIFNYEKRPVAAAVVTGPAYRMTNERLKLKIIKSVKETAMLISSKLFYSELEGSLK